MRVVIDRVLVSKVTGQSGSSSERLAEFRGAVEVFENAGIWRAMFGHGYGYVRSTDLAATLLVNIGVAGLFASLGFIVWLLIRAMNIGASDLAALGATVGAAATLIVMFAGVPELPYQPLWLALGIAFAPRCRTSRAEASASSSTASRLAITPPAHRFVTEL